MSPILAMPVTTVQKMIGAMIILTMRMNAVPNGCMLVAKDFVAGTRPSTTPRTIPNITQK